MPEYEVSDRHQIRVLASAATTFSAAKELELTQSAVIQAIFRSRELILHAQPSGLARPETLVAQMKSLGWGVLAEMPDHEIVIGGSHPTLGGQRRDARAKFRRYWSFFSPGIILIRRIALRSVKREAERRAHT